MQRHTCNEQSISSKHDPLVPIFRIITDAILRMARGVQGSDRDALSDLEFLPVLGGLGYQLAVLSTDNRQLAKVFELKWSVVLRNQ